MALSHLRLLKSRRAWAVVFATGLAPALLLCLTAYPHTAGELRPAAGHDSGEPIELPKEAKDVAAEIERLGGTTEVDEKSPGRPVVGVQLGGTDVRDRDLALLKGLPDLRRLSLAFTGITDAGVGHLKRMTGLRQLDLSHTQVTDRGLEDLRGLNQLRQLALHGVKVGPGAEQRLRLALPKLEIDRGNRNTAQKRAHRHFAMPGNRPRVGAKDPKCGVAGRACSW